MIKFLKNRWVSFGYDDYGLKCIFLRIVWYVTSFIEELENIHFSTKGPWCANSIVRDRKILYGAVFLGWIGSFQDSLAVGITWFMDVCLREICLIFSVLLVNYGWFLSWWLLKFIPWLVVCLFWDLGCKLDLIWYGNWDIIDDFAFFTCFFVKYAWKAQ